MPEPAPVVAWSGTPSRRSEGSRTLGSGILTAILGRSSIVEDLRRAGESSTLLEAGDQRPRIGVPWEVCGRHPMDVQRKVILMADRSHFEGATLTSHGPLPMRGPFTRWPRCTDALLAVIAFGATAFQGSFEDPVANQGFTVGLIADVPISAYVILGLASAALYRRRSEPLPVLAVNLVVSAVWVAFKYVEDPSFGLLFALYSVGRYEASNQRSLAAIGGALAAISVEDLILFRPISDIGFNLVVMLLAWYFGRRIRIRRDYLAMLQERADYRERERIAEAQMAVDVERARIARELHDVVAHRVSMITVQAGAAKTVAADDPDGARRAMEAVEHEGRQALTELRHLLGVLRPDMESGGLGPQPGVDQIQRLVDQLGEAGLDVRLIMERLPDDLPARVDLSAYRIVQEGLTNVLKHAGADAGAEVRLSSSDGALDIQVLDQGRGVTILPGAGHGIVGMRERAQLLGGTFDAGPRPGGGFQVIARLPIRDERT